MRQVKFVSRTSAIKMLSAGLFAPSQGPCLISISDTDTEVQEIREQWEQHAPGRAADACFARFLDIDDARSGLSETQAQQLVALIDHAHRTRRDLVVHCFFGVSRSGAVAKFANDYLGLEDLFLEDYTQHNKHVYYCLMEAAGIPTLRQYYQNMEQKGPQNV